jgi:hypothetical protein
MSTITDKIDFYCLNFNNNNTRKKKIEKKMDYFNIPIYFYSGVTKTDPRICNINNNNIQRSSSICYGHLDMIKHFLDNSQKEYIVIMEDDIIIRHSLIDDLEKMIDIVIKHQYDIVLLGYLCHNPIDTYCNFPHLPNKYSSNEFKILTDYPSDTWGTQMYMLTKKQCNFLINKYYTGYFEKSLFNSSMIPFSADWIITKDGKRCLLYPPRASEEYIENTYNDKGQEICRYNCDQFINREDYI